MKRARERALIAVVAALALASQGCRHELHPRFEPPVVCRTTQPVTESVFLIGDAGAPKPADPVLGALERDVAASVDAIGGDRPEYLLTRGVDSGCLERRVPVPGGYQRPAPRVILRHSGPVGDRHHGRMGEPVRQDRVGASLHLLVERGGSVIEEDPSRLV